MKKAIITTTLLACLSCAPAVFADEIININKADVATLDSLAGIGKKKAEAIVAYRTDHGEFKTLDELKEVSGIGDKLFEKIKDSITLTDDTTTTETAASSNLSDKAETKPANKTDKVSEKSESKTSNNNT